MHRWEGIFQYLFQQYSTSPKIAKMLVDKPKKQICNCLMTAEKKICNGKTMWYFFLHIFLLVNFTLRTKISIKEGHLSSIIFKQHVGALLVENKMFTK